MSLLGEVQRLDTATDFMEVGVHRLLVNLQIIAQVLRINLEVIDDASEHTAMRDQEIDVELSHLASFGELSANALDNGLGRGSKEFPKLVAWRHLDALLMLNLLLPFSNWYQLEDISSDDSLGIVYVLDLGRFQVGDGHRSGFINNSL
ncbi:hypothetical protein HG531_003018 [Fusarium graminearum]|nr:hypothetical protein HG531_003018 [Fusarium graminearum]